MGWGFDDLFDTITDFIGISGQSQNISNGIVSDDTQKALTRIVISEWASSLTPDIPEMESYIGGLYRPPMIGWPVLLGVEAMGTPGVLPQGAFFIGHPVPGMILESFRMTQAGTDLAVDYYTKASFIARLIQRDQTGRVINIDGYELGVRVGTGEIVREDLRLDAKSPLTAEVRYGGPITPYLPMYIVITPYGDFGGITGLDGLQVQATATFLCPQVTAAPSAASPRKPDADEKEYPIWPSKHLLVPF